VCLGKKSVIDNVSLMESYAKSNFVSNFLPDHTHSEGQGLNHDDRRTYLGEIEAVTPEDNSGTDHLCVQGSVVYGSDFDEGARPLPVGTFVMREIQDDSDDEEEAEIDDDEAFQ
jgi:hypothetical protein